MGPSVRRLYVQGKEVNGAGINASFAVAAGHRRPRDRLRARLVGGARLALHVPDDAGVRVQVRHLRRARHPARRRARHHREPLPPLRRAGHEQARTRSCNSAESITGPISKTISKQGIRAVYEALGRRRQGGVRGGLRRGLPGRARGPARRSTTRSSSGNEIRSVVLAGERLKTQPDGQDRRHRDVEGRRRRCAPSASRTKIPAQPVHGRRLHRDDDGADRHPARARPPVLGGRQRVGHRVRSTR